MIEAPKPYAIRQREARAAASVKRKAAEAEGLRQLILILEAKRLAKQAVRENIRASGKKITDYTVLEINRMAEALAPQFVEQAQARIAQNLKVMSKSERPVPQAVSMLRSHAQNEVAQ